MPRIEDTKKVYPEELFKVYDKKGNMLEIKEKEIISQEIINEAKKYGEPTHTVPVIHLLLYNAKNQLYIIKRANKSENPFMFDKTVGGHVRYNETFEKTAIRETKEEIDVDVLMTDSKDYFMKIKSTDLTRYAVVKSVDFEPWSKSIRVLRNDTSIITKYDRVKVFVGQYDGNIKFNDGEAIDCILKNTNELLEDFIHHPNLYTYDLQELVYKCLRK